MNKNTTFVGNIGEQIAVDHLISKGYRILERNAKICGSEIDIICEAYLKPDGSVIPVKCGVGAFVNRTNVRQSGLFGKNISLKGTERVIVFCEVKTRIGNEFGSAVEAVTPYKIGRYVKAAKAYTSSSKYSGCNIRFDVIEVGEGGINHIEGAFWENDAKYPRRR